MYETHRRVAATPPCPSRRRNRRPVSEDTAHVPAKRACRQLTKSLSCRDEMALLRNQAPQRRGSLDVLVMARRECPIRLAGFAHAASPVLLGAPGAIRPCDPLLR